MFKFVRSLLVLGMVVAGLLVASPSALAAKGHGFDLTFAEEGSGAGQLKEPSAVAVNEVTVGLVGEVYVADTGNNRIERFSEGGTELKGEFDGSVTPAGSFSEPSQIAVDNSQEVLDPSRGDVYVADFGHSVVDKFSAEGAYLGQITTGREGAPLGEIYGVAVDGQGVVWLYQASAQIDSYSDALSNEFLSATESPFGTAPGFTVDSQDNLYVNRGVQQIAKLDSTGNTLVEAMNPEGSATAVAVDDADNLFIDEGARISGLDPQASVVERFGQGHVANSHGIAINSASGLAYAANRENGTVTVFANTVTPTVVTGDAANLTSEGFATLSGTVNPEGMEVTSCLFEYGLGDDYGSTAECTPDPGSGEGPVTVHADISGLEVGKYHFRIAAANVNGESVGFGSAFIAGGKPTIFGQELAGAGVTTAKISAQLNPEGQATTYQLQYGRTTAYGSSTALQEAGAGLSATGIVIALAELEEGTEYHARLMASNALGSTSSPDIQFRTSMASATSASVCPNKTNSGFSSLLADCRAYEAVSPGGGPGEVYVPAGSRSVPSRNEDIITPLPMRAAEQGSAVSYVAEPGEAGGSGATGRGLGNQFLAERDATQNRWNVSTVTPTIDTAEELPSSYNPSYQAFSSDLSSGILVSSSQSFAAKTTPAGPQPCTVLYSRSSDSQFHALYTTTLTPGFCGLTQESEPFALRNLMFAGGNRGAAGVAPNSHLLLQSPAALTEGAEESAEEAASNLYESIEGVVRLVSVLPGGEPDANAVFGGPPTEPRNSRPDFENVISANGSRIFWTDLTSGHIYMRLNGTITVPISEGRAKFWSATPDGSVVFYTEGESLWRYEIESADREELAGPGSGVQGVTGVSEEGSYIYFVAAGALSGGAEARLCRTADEEEEEKIEKGEFTGLKRLEEEQHEENLGLLPKGRGCNLYLLHGGARSLIAVLGAHDNQLIRSASGRGVKLGSWQPELGSRTAQLADGGRELVFESTQRLTGYDNSNLTEFSTEFGFEYGVEVFVYDANSARLTCASCDPAGAPPAKEPSDTRAGTYLPISLSTTSLRRWVSADGSRVFFDSSQPLVPQDSNGVQDVYEWEREGTAGCPSATSKWGGCISLMSGGDSSDFSFFVDASADGGDVFFTHRGQLSGVGRRGGLAELFDARVDGGFPESSTACTGTGCQGVPPAPPSFASPSSSTFNGPGNFPPPQSVKGKVVARKTPGQIKAEKLAKALKACKKQRQRRERVVCKRRARGLYESVRAKGRRAARRRAAKGKAVVSGRLSDRGNR